MIHPDSDIRAAVYTALTSPLVIFEDRTISVYDSLADDDADAPYVIMDGQYSLPDHTKDSFRWISHLTLRVIDLSVADTSGRARAEAVAQLVLNRLIPSSPGGIIPLVISGWKLWKIGVEPRDLTRTTETGEEYQKILTVTFNIT